MKTALYRIWSPFFRCVASLTVPNPISDAAYVPAGQRYVALAVLGYLSFVGGDYPPRARLSLRARAPCTTDATGTPQRALRLCRAKQRARFTGLGLRWPAVKENPRKPIRGSSIGRASGC